jgi:transcriptional regulator with XRE-family HTH domain
MIIADYPLRSNSGFSAAYNILEVIDLYKRIRELREDKDLRQKDIAAYLSCSQRVYSNYERGDLDIPTEVLIKLSEFHGVSIDYLLGMTDDMKRK